MRNDPEVPIDFDDDDWDDDDTCPDCHGEGGFHDCGEDTCCCLHKSEHTDVCGTCRGRGWVSSPPHMERTP